MNAGRLGLIVPSSYLQSGLVARSGAGAPRSPLESQKHGDGIINFLCVPFAIFASSRFNFLLSSCLLSFSLPPDPVCWGAVLARPGTS
jgi:hypothetical protein